MIAAISHEGEEFKVNLNQGIDLSIPMNNQHDALRAWYLDEPKIEPVRGDGFVGAVSEGGSVNFRNIFFNPHGHTTHTECMGHITEEIHSVQELIQSQFFLAELISIEPESISDDQVITHQQILDRLGNKSPEAVIFRTLPNDTSKLNRHYSSTNPAYLEEAVAIELRKRNVKHLLIDTPSVDREEDEGKLLSHHAFWNIPENPRKDCSITELIYVPNSVQDGKYLLNLSFANFVNDASPSRPMIYSLL